MHLIRTSKRTVCGDWVVETVELELVTHHPVTEPVSGQRAEVK
jgi:hypothetical protein